MANRDAMEEVESPLGDSGQILTTSGQNLSSVNLASATSALPIASPLSSDSMFNSHLSRVTEASGEGAGSRENSGLGFPPARPTQHFWLFRFLDFFLASTLSSSILLLLVGECFLNWCTT